MQYLLLSLQTEKGVESEGFAVTVMKIVVIADTHGLHDQVRVPDGDMLIVAGDFTNTGKSTQVSRAAVWLSSLPHKHKIAVAGTTISTSNESLHTRLPCLPSVASFTCKIPASMSKAFLSMGALGSRPS